jgi:protein arginine kinase
MKAVKRETESWKRMVLRSMPQPAWLGEDAPHVDVVLSTRTRLMRNLRFHRFPNRADVPELQEVMRKILRAARDADLALDAYKGLTNAERDYLVGCRLVSPDFEWTLQGRALLIDEHRSVSLMINEEDHLRLQALSAGWSIPASDAMASRYLDALEARLDFAWSPKYGYLSASPFNSGLGRRQSAMFHLIGLAQAKRLPSVMKALSAKGIVVRGLFGEASRAIGAFVQVSVLGGTREDFSGACEYLMREERQARSTIDRAQLQEKAERAKDFALGSRTISLADALRVLAWIRWGSYAELPGFKDSVRTVDATLTTLEIRSTVVESDAARERSDSLRAALG